ncbi:hypothetical protein A7X74_10890 [Stenotrophomonas maltophilia]|uniref:hypothetical protein n=1 Tax=Stenotrophomonas maltophilia TaxID=40324 RepID=UPI000DB705F8|nr:hypothetical protein [Stenotrophomonas maltophilia]PZS80528.1 hypothetical protein A7X74_10890 [Stenotrophomonas maltophilia]
MSNDNKTLADMLPGGRVRLTTVPYDRARDLIGDAYTAGTHGIGYSQQAMELQDAIIPAQHSPGDQDALAALQQDYDKLLDSFNRQVEVAEKIAGRVLQQDDRIEELEEALAARQPVGSEEAHILPPLANERMLDAGWPYGEVINGKFDRQGAYADLLSAAPPVGLLQTFQAGVAEWMGQCFLPSLYSDMTERGDRLLEEVLELLQAHGYDRARVPTLVDYVFGRPVGEPVQEVGGVMVTLAGYCWVAGIDMHAAGDAELARINQPDVMAKIRAKQEAKNALHFDTPLPGDPAATEAWPREGDLVRYGDGASALAIRLEPHAGGWHGYQCCGGYTFFTKAYKPSRADMDTWLDCAKYRDERTKVADSRVAHEMYLLDSQAVGNG